MTHAFINIYGVHGIAIALFAASCFGTWDSTTTRRIERMNAIGNAIVNGDGPEELLGERRWRSSKKDSVPGYSFNIEPTPVGKDYTYMTKLHDTISHHGTMIETFPRVFYQHILTLFLPVQPLTSLVIEYVEDPVLGGLCVGCDNCS